MAYNKQLHADRVAGVIDAFQVFDEACAHAAISPAELDDVLVLVGKIIEFWNHFLDPDEEGGK